MLKLYHGSSSVCSSKVRVGLAEKQLEWESYPINLPAGEQFHPDYLKVNRNGVVPTLIDDGFVIFESSIILEYIDGLSADNLLMPDNSQQQVTTKLWLLRCIDIHAAINTMTFSTANRDKILASNTPEQIAESIAKMPNPKAAAKRKDLLENGLNSSYVTNDFYVLRQMFDDMQDALTKTAWLINDEYTMADAAIISYIDRLDRLGMAGLWTDRTPAVGKWLAASRARPSYEVGINKFIAAKDADSMRKTGGAKWPEVERKWLDFLAKGAQ
jgi:glutathione S-transferase